VFVREGRRWDFIYMGILRDEWASQPAGQALYSSALIDPPRKEKVS
jgi:hypothetical protein